MNTTTQEHHWKKFTSEMPDSLPDLFNVNMPSAGSNSTPMSAHSPNFQKGFDEGYADGQKQAQAELADQLADMTRICAQLKQTHSKLLSESLKDLVGILQSFFKQLLHIELSTNSNVIQNLVDQLRSELDLDAEVLVYLNPDVHARLISVTESISTQLRPDKTLPDTVVRVVCGPAFYEVDLIANISDHFSQALAQHIDAQPLDPK
ncbi:MAG: hypothetical protein GXP16_01380 [Gammaproteobacteria bacterium]|nr:hypothetical protein [Gammaproteobacteria bacterium]